MALTFSDEPTIRNALMKRLPKEPGITVVDIVITKRPDCIFVGIDAEIDANSDAALITRSKFELPRWFDYQHLHDEIDQVCEQFKAARKQHHGRALAGQVVQSAEIALAGTGRRGLWRKYA